MLRLSSGFRVLTLQIYSYFKFWPKIVNILGRHGNLSKKLINVNEIFSSSALEQQMIRPNAGIYY